MPAIRGYIGPQPRRSATSSARYVKVTLPKRRKAKKSTKKPKSFNSKVENVITNRRESKYSPQWYSYDDHDPALTGGFIQDAIQGAYILPNAYPANRGRVSFVGFQTGNYLNAASDAVNALVGGSMYPLGGFGMQRGDTATTIDGNYAYMHSSHISLTVSAQAADTGFDQLNAAMTPLEFRVIHVRAKKDQAGVTPSLVGSLFSDLTNAAEGLNGNATKKELFTDWVINSNRFQKVNDVKFKLSQPMQPGFNLQLPCAVGNTGSSNLNYPIKKHLKFYLNKPAKQLKFSQTDNGLNNAYEPINYDFVDYVIILCSRDYGPLTGTAQGQTSYNNTGKCWQVAATGQTKYKDC